MKEPIIPLSLLQVFVDAACNPNTTDPEAAMYQVISHKSNGFFWPIFEFLMYQSNVSFPMFFPQAISELPQPNRDTLAYLMIHLQTIAANYKINKVCVIKNYILFISVKNSPPNIIDTNATCFTYYRWTLKISLRSWDQQLSGILHTNQQP